jgi:hypothetical protein
MLLLYVLQMGREMVCMPISGIKLCCVPIFAILLFQGSMEIEKKTPFYLQF